MAVLVSERHKGYELRVLKPWRGQWVEIINAFGCRFEKLSPLSRAISALDAFVVEIDCRRYRETNPVGREMARRMRFVVDDFYRGPIIFTASGPGKSLTDHQISSICRLYEEVIYDDKWR